MSRGCLDVAHGLEPFGDRGGNAIRGHGDIKTNGGVVWRGDYFSRSNLGNILHVHHVGTAPDDGLQLGWIINAALVGCPDLVVDAIQSKNQIFSNVLTAAVKASWLESNDKHVEVNP